MDSTRRDFLALGARTFAAALAFPLEAFAKVDINQSFPPEAETEERARLVRERQQLMDFFGKWFAMSPFGKTFATSAALVQPHTVNALKTTVLTAAFEKIERGQSGIAFLTREEEVVSAAAEILADADDVKRPNLIAMIHSIVAGAAAYLEMIEVRPR